MYIIYGDVRLATLLRDWFAFPFQTSYRIPIKSSKFATFFTSSTLKCIHGCWISVSAERLQRITYLLASVYSFISHSCFSDFITWHFPSRSVIATIAFLLSRKRFCLECAHFSFEIYSRNVTISFPVVCVRSTYYCVSQFFPFYCML